MPIQGTDYAFQVGGVTQVKKKHKVFENYNEP